MYMFIITCYAFCISLIKWVSGNVCMLLCRVKQYYVLKFWREDCFLKNDFTFRIQATLELAFYDSNRNLQLAAFIAGISTILAVLNA